LARIADRADLNRLDVETVGFHLRVRDGYHRLIQEDPTRWRVLDGNASEDEVHRMIKETLSPHLAKCEQPA
jgi:dTMP kinase